MSEDANKDIPSVGKPEGGNKVLGIGLLVSVMALIIYGVFSKDKEVKAQAVGEYRPSGYTNDRVFEREVPKKKPEKPKENTNAKSVSRDELLAFLAEQKRAEEQVEAQIEDKKRRSNTNIFKRKDTAQNTNNSKLRTNPVYPISLNDQSQPKEEGMLNLGVGKAVDTEYAMRINNTSLTIAPGKFIRGVLETSIDSTLPGQVRAVVANDIYSENGSRVLINKGSRLVGQYQSGIKQGQNRVFVIWSHVTLSNGIQISLESSGTDALGTAGLSGDYDSHFFKRFGGALLLSVIEGYGDDNSSLNINGGNALSRASAVALDNTINIPPTIYVDQGSTINVFIARNLNFEGVL